MDAMAGFGIFGFCMALAAWSKVKRLERLLRENGIRSQASRGLKDQLRDRVGQTLTLSMYTSDEDVVGAVCRVLDVDEEWALVLVHEGKKKERRKLIRLDDVKQVKG